MTGPNTFQFFYKVFSPSFLLHCFRTCIVARHPTWLLLSGIPPPLRRRSRVCLRCATRVVSVSVSVRACVLVSLVPPAAAAVAMSAYARVEIKCEDTLAYYEVRTPTHTHRQTKADREGSQRHMPSTDTSARSDGPCDERRDPPRREVRLLFRVSTSRSTALAGDRRADHHRPAWWDERPLLVGWVGLRLTVAVVVLLWLWSVWRTLGLTTLRVT